MLIPTAVAIDVIRAPCCCTLDGCQMAVLVALPCARIADYRLYCTCAVLYMYCVVLYCCAVLYCFARTIEA